MKRINPSKRVRGMLQRLADGEENPERFFKAMEKQRHGNGVVNFTSYPNLGLLLRPGDKQKICFGLPWQTFTEVGMDHGLSLIHTLLEETPFAYPVSQDTRLAFREKIQRAVHARYWHAFQRSLREKTIGLADLEERNSKEDILLCAIWAHLETERFGPIWLAAMAQHAYWIEEDEYAFGYLIALLDQKLSNESHFLRGKKGLESAGLGGQVRAAKAKPKTKSVLIEMDRHISGGKSIARAADLTFRAGQGSSSSANRKLWSRHRK